MKKFRIFQFFVVSVMASACSKPQQSFNSAIGQSYISTQENPAPKPTAVLSTEKHIYDLPLVYTITNECSSVLPVVPYLIEADGNFTYEPLKNVSYSPPLMSLRKGSRKLTEAEMNRVILFLNNSNLENLAGQITRSPPDSIRPAICANISNLTIKVDNIVKNYSLHPYDFIYPQSYGNELSRLYNLLEEYKNIEPGNHSYKYDFPLAINSYKSCGNDNGSSLLKELFYLKENGTLYYNFNGDYRLGRVGIETLPFIQLSEEELKAAREFLEKLKIATEGEKLTPLSEAEVEENYKQCDWISDHFLFKVNGTETSFFLEDRRYMETESYKKSLNDLKTYMIDLVNNKLK